MRCLFASLLATAIIVSALCSPVAAQTAPNAPIVPAQPTIAAPAPVTLPAQPAWDQKVPLQVQLPPQAPAPSSLLDIGQMFGPIIAPYANAIIMALITAFFTWLGGTRLGQSIDAAHRATLEAGVKNAATSMIADGVVKTSGLKIDVNNPAFAAALKEAATALTSNTAKAAAKNFGLTPDDVAAKIIDAIPQTTAGAAIIAQAHATATAPPAAQQPAA